MATVICPQCKRPLEVEVRAGVRLSTFKAKLFDHIRRQPGHSARELAEYMYGDTSRKKEQSLRSHVSQIRLALEGTGTKLEGGIFTGYIITGLKK